MPRRILIISTPGLGRSPMLEIVAALKDEVFEVRFLTGHMRERALYGMNPTAILADRFDIIQPAVCPPKNAPHGPKRVGKGGKVKRW